MNTPIFSFGTLRQANTLRLPTFKNKHGERAHAKDDGSDWSLAEWANAMGGEVGELAEAYLLLSLVRAAGSVGNLTKKIGRGDVTLTEATAELSSELADVIVYADLLAFRAGFDLGAAVLDKFNAVSMRVRSPVVLEVAPGSSVGPPRVFVSHKDPGGSL